MRAGPRLRASYLSPATCGVNEPPAVQGAAADQCRGYELTSSPRWRAETVKWKGLPASTNVDDRRGAGGGRIAIGGGAAIVIMIVAALLGANPGEVLDV